MVSPGLEASCAAHTVGRGLSCAPSLQPSGGQVGPTWRSRWLRAAGNVLAGPGLSAAARDSLIHCCSAHRLGQLGLRSGLRFHYWELGVQGVHIRALGLRAPRPVCLCPLAVPFSGLGPPAPGFPTGISTVPVVGGGELPECEGRPAVCRELRNLVEEKQK